MRKLVLSKEIKISLKTTVSEIRLSRELIRTGYSKTTLAIQETKASGLLQFEGNQNLLVHLLVLKGKQVGGLFWLWSNQTSTIVGGFWNYVTCSRFKRIRKGCKRACAPHAATTDFYRIY